MGTVTVDQAKTVMNTFMTVFEDNLVTGQAVSWNEHTGEMDDRNKLTVVEQVTPKYKITRTQNGVKDLSAGTDGTAFGSEQFTIDGTFNANMGWGDFVKIRDIGEARNSKALIGAATSLAEQIDAYILGVAFTASDEWTGVVGQTIANYADVAAGYVRLKEEGVGDNDLRVILPHYARGALGDAVTKNTALSDIASDVYQKGFKQNVAGLDAEFTNSLPVLTTGTRSAGASTVNGAAQNVDYATAAISVANGQFLTQTIIVAGLGANATIAKGEVFTMAGVFAYDPLKQAAVAPARLQQFVSVNAVVADGAGAATFRIFPAMVVPGSGAGDNININSANATVTAAPANGALLTFMGIASTNYSAGLIIQKEAIVVDTVQLIMPATGIALRKKLSRIPVSVRMWQHSDFNTGAHNVRFDVAMNANIRERRRVMRISGGAVFS
jgi:hypothetical protein